VTGVVLDASALLALLQEESGAKKVEAVLPGAAIGTVNLAEVVGKLRDVGMPEEEIQEAIGALGLEVIPFDEELGYQTGFLYPGTKGRGLSLGDRACLALGLQLHLPVVTADRSWLGLKLGVEVKTIR